MLNICVAGWYLDEFDDFYASLYRVRGACRIFVVSNRPSEYLDQMDLPYAVRENVGLEWGAYNHYLMNVWDGRDGVLFCHDDIELLPVVIDGELQEPEFIFEQIVGAGVDCAYVFGSRHEDVENRGMHGRMVYMGRDFLTRIKSAGGFWYDEENHGTTTGDDVAYNAGILAFDEQRKRIGGDVGRKMYIPVFSLAKRGVRGSATVHYGAWMDKVGAVLDRPGDKLHVGCGETYWPTHTNVDLHSEKADIQADAVDLPLDSDSFDLVESHHLIEHMTRTKAQAALREWFRVLAPGGHVFLSCPDIIAFFDLLRDSDSPELWDALMGAIYGQESPGMAHLYGYSRRSLGDALRDAGFVDVEVKTALGYRPTPSLLAFARKPLRCTDDEEIRDVNSQQDGVLRSDRRIRSVA